MPSPLVIPGVQVQTAFEPAPVLPGATGILGVVGVADRGPLLPTPISNFGEFIEIFGPASQYTMPEVRNALANGVAQVVVARTTPGVGRKAAWVLTDDDGDQVVRLEARAEGEWANRLTINVSQVKALSGLGVKYVTIEVAQDGKVIETLANMVMDESSPDYLFNKVNAHSKVLVAVDPLFGTDLPEAVTQAALADADARAASASLKAGGAFVVTVEAKRVGRGGNQVAVRVRDGRSGLLLTGANGAPSVEIRARQPGADPTKTIKVSVEAGPTPNTVRLFILAPPAAQRAVGPFASVEEIVAGLRNDPDVIVLAPPGAVMPSVISATPLQRRVEIDVFAEGRDTTTYPDLATVDAIAAINDPTVKFQVAPGATQLPEANDGVPLTAGRSKGAALPLTGANRPEPLLELVPAPGATGPLAVSVARGVSSLDNATAVVNVNIFVGNELVETFADLTLDPDDPNYLPLALESSALLRAFDLFVRTRTTSFPRELVKPATLAARGASPTPDDYLSALERLESSEEVDLVIASVNNQYEKADANIRAIHQMVVAHCTKMADVARNRIGLGSVTRGETASIPQMLDHANDVRSEYFILTAPVGTEAAVAGLLGRQDFFESPTFKTVASLDVPAGRYSDAQLTQLISGNVLVVNSRRHVGNIVVKGILTNGRQVNVQRTANKAVRDVKAICDQYIGLLNNEGTRNALKQQVFARLLQMERDGALVPSTDGKDPAFKVEVYSTQADFAIGIVRVDIAVRPVRAIDYIYARILVKN
jgi:hypothetical protein